MTEQFPITTHNHDAPARPTIIEGIQNISKFVGLEVAEKMIQEVWAGRGIIAEDDRLKVDIAACTQQRQVIEEQIRQNELRRQDLAEKVEDALKREEEMQTFIDGFDKFVHSEEGNKASQVEAVSEVAQTSPLIPPRPTVAPRLPTVEQRELSEFRDISVQRPLGRMAVVQAITLPSSKH